MSKVFQCVLCEERFTEDDFKKLLFFPSTCICRSCYNDANKDKSVCFGKKEHYDNHSLVCRKICQDRKVCLLYVRIEKYA